MTNGVGFDIINAEIEIKEMPTMKNETIYAILDAASEFSSLSMRLNLALTKVYDSNMTEQECIDYCRKMIQSSASDALDIFNGILTDVINP